MYKKTSLIICALSLVIGSLPSWLVAQQAISPPANLKLPVAKIDNVTDDYFGVKVVDPYRWMEEGPGSPDLLEFLKSQNDYTKSMLQPLSGPRNKLLNRLHELDNAITYRSIGIRAGGKRFYAELIPEAGTSSLMVTEADGTSRKLFDPESYGAPGSHAAIDYWNPSQDGNYLVVGVSQGGSENDTIRIVEVQTGRLLEDSISRTQYGGPSWRPDGHSFYYNRLQKVEPGAPPSAIYENQRVYLHVLGNDPENDPPVFGPGVSKALEVPKAGFSDTEVVPGCPYVIAYHSAGTVDRASLYIAPLAQAGDSNTPWRKIASSEDKVYSTAMRGSTLYILTEKDAPNRKLLVLDLDHPDLAHARVLVPASQKVLGGLHAAADALYVRARLGLKLEIQRIPFNKREKSGVVPLPYQGTIGAIDANVRFAGVIFGLTSWTQSTAAFSYDPASNKVTALDLIPRNPVDFSSVVAREVEVRSTDGAMVPLSIRCRKDIVLDGSHPTLYEGYGGYGSSSDAYFDPASLAWIERGGVIAWAHLRGGGEYGESWHDAARKSTKQHTIDDMIAAARYLIENHYTSPSHLAVRGTSAGGIAVGGALVQHPELFAVAVDNVGVTDLLRFQGTQGGAANIPELGDVRDPKDFKYLYAVSPYHHVVDGTSYPAVLAMTGVNDPRVPSWMIAKMVARLQAASSSKKPVLMRVDFDSGHGFGTTRTQYEEVTADEWSFLLWQLGDPDFAPRTTQPGN